MSKILVIGDLHNDWGLLRDIALYAKHGRFDAIIQVGDLCWRDDAIPVERFAVPVFAIDGNHDDQLYLIDHSFLGICAQRGLHYMRRGHVYEIFGVSIGAIGGAKNVYSENQSIELFHQTISNQISNDDLAHAIAEFNEKQPGIIVSHDVPTSCCDQSLVPPSSAIEGGDAQLERLLHSLAYRPQHWLFGHYHPLGITSYQRNDISFHCLPAADRELRGMLIDGDGVKPMKVSLGKQP